MPLRIVKADVTEMNCDAIVNTTNPQMIGYSGVDLAVHAKAGPKMDEACRALAPLELGFAAITEGFALPCKYVIHTCGPTWQGGRAEERAILQSCYVESLKLAKRYKCKTVAFPLISSGFYGFPKDKVLSFASKAISEFLTETEMTVFLCVYDKESVRLSQSVREKIEGYLRKNLSDEYEVAQKVRMTFGKSPARRKEIRRKLQDEACLGIPLVCEEYAALEADSIGGLERFLEQEQEDGFADTLFKLIDEKGITDVACYKGANVDKKVFSKIKCNPKYKPSKSTALAFAVSLKLSLAETNRLLATAGLALSSASKFDMIVKYFISRKHYDIFEINEALYSFDQTLLGSQ